MLPSLTKIYVGDPIYIQEESAEGITAMVEKRVIALKDKSTSFKPKFNS
jgi:hypothetical protein